MAAMNSVRIDENIKCSRLDFRLSVCKPFP